MSLPPSQRLCIPRSPLVVSTLRSATERSSLLLEGVSNERPASSDAWDTNANASAKGFRTQGFHREPQGVVGSDRALRGRSHRHGSESHSCFRGCRASERDHDRAPSTTAAAPTEASATTEAAPTRLLRPSSPSVSENAIESAQDYLKFSAFSESGLTDQLSSKYGDGFSKADAVFAVNHIDVDWSDTCKSAKEYLDISSFRSGLIDQLESNYGEGFTHSQAVYGVNDTGLAPNISFHPLSCAWRSLIAREASRRFSASGYWVL